MCAFELDPPATGAEACPKLELLGGYHAVDNLDDIVTGHVFGGVPWGLNDDLSVQPGVLVVEEGMLFLLPSYLDEPGLLEVVRGGGTGGGWGGG